MFLRFSVRIPTHDLVQDKYRTVRIVVNLLWVDDGRFILGTLCLFLVCSMTAYAVVGMQLLKGLYFFCEEEEGDDFFSADVSATKGPISTSIALLLDSAMRTACCHGMVTS